MFNTTTKVVLYLVTLKIISSLSGVTMLCFNWPKSTLWFLCFPWGNYSCVKDETFPAHFESLTERHNEDISMPFCNLPPQITAAGCWIFPDFRAFHLWIIRKVFSLNENIKEFTYITVTVPTHFGKPQLTMSLYKLHKILYYFKKTPQTVWFLMQP